MTSSILFAGSEDISFTCINGQITASMQTTFGTGVSGYGWQPITATTGSYRPGYARYGLAWYFNSGNVGDQSWIRTLQFSTGSANTTASSFWTTARLYANTGSSSATNRFMRFVDSAGVVRLRIRTTTTYPSTIVLEKTDSAGSVTTLATSAGTFGSNAPSTPDKVDVFINYAVSGTFSVYLNGSLVVTYAGDLTTNSQTALAFVDFGQITVTNGGGALFTVWSEVIVATRDTRNMSLVTQAPAVNGNTDAWTLQGTNSILNFITQQPTTNSGRSANEITYMRFVPTANGTISTAQFNLQSAITSTTQMAIYSDVTGNSSSTTPNPLTLLGSTSTVSNPGAGFTTYTWSSPITVFANVVYWLAYRSSAAYTWIYSGNVTSTYVWGSQLGQTSFPSSATATMSGNVTISATYTLAITTVGTMLADYADSDSSATANQVQEYQVGPSLPTGNFSVVSLVQHISSTIGTSGPTKVDATVRFGGSDYFSPDISPTTAWTGYAYHWDTNPNTTVAWQTSDLASASTSFNIGYKSIT